VLYELLMGRVPFHADDSLAVGIMHITQPIPVLPEAFAALQNVLNHLLAKQPAERYQNGESVADAIEQLEVSIARGDIPELAATDDTYRRQILGIDTPTQVQMPAHTPPAGVRYRSEPSLGRMDDVATSAARRPQRAPAARATATEGRSRGWLVMLALVLVLAGAFAAWRYQDRLRAMLPKTELNDIVARGDKALADGKLVGTQGDSARELFQSARALDPDNEQVRQGLNKVGQRLIEQGRAALTRNDFVTARTNLAAATDVLGGGAEIDELKSALHAAENRNTASEDLLRRADAALGAGVLLGDKGASTLYLRVLDADATNALALNGLKKVTEAVAQQARDAIAAGNAELANQRIADLTQLSPNHPAIPELRAALAQAHENEGQALEQQLSRAETQLRAGKNAGDDGAFALFQAVLKRDANNARAKAGMRKVAQALVVQANAALDEKNTAQAEKLLQTAEIAAPDLPEMRSAKSRLREMREQLDIGKQQAQVTPADQARIQPLLDEADAALTAGNLILPPGESAYDKYRAVLRIDGNNGKAFAGLSKIPARAKELFERALKENTPNKARAHIDAIAQADPSDASLPALRERLANVFLDAAQTRIDESRRNEALRALNNARELSPNNPRLHDIESKAQALPPQAAAAQEGG
jgi:serine/threonine-protein kinase PpkA